MKNSLEIVNTQIHFPVLAYLRRIYNIDIHTDETTPYCTVRPKYCYLLRLIRSQNTQKNSP